MIPIAKPKFIGSRTNENPLLKVPPARRGNPELITTARKTIAQLARTQHPYPNHIPNRYYRHFQRYFAPDAAFQHLFRHTLHAVPTDHPYTIALDGTTVPRTGAYIPGAQWCWDVDVVLSWLCAFRL
jgi:hypothetical protein